MLNKKDFSFLLLVIIIGLANPVHSQILTGGLPFIQNYNKEDYKTSENQHWAVIQNKEGLIFFGNNEGLLIFDGVNWELLELPNKSVVRSLAIDSKGVIYVGGKNEFGMLSGNAELGYKYISLADSLAKEDKIMEDIWRIYVNERDEIIFQSVANVIIWDHTRFKVMFPKDKFHLSFFVNNTFYVNERNHKGLQVYEDGALMPVSNAEALVEYSIYEILPYSNTELLIVTRSQGTLIYNINTGLISENANWNATNEVLKTLRVFSAKKYAVDTYLFGTLKGGLVIVKNGKIEQILNKELGLIDNTIWSLFIDQNKNLFIALDNGISYVSLNSPVRLFNQSSGINNGVLAIEKFDDKLYLGTINGIMVSDSKSKFSEAGDNIGFVWQLITIDNELYATTYNGLLKLNSKGKFIRIGPPEFVWKVIVLKQYPNKVIAGIRDGGLMIFERTDQGLVYLKKINGFDRSSRWFEEDSKGRIWVSHYNRGVTLLNLSNNADSVVSIDYFSAENGLPSNTNNYVFKSAKFSNQLGIIVGTENGAFTFNDSLKQFQKIDILEPLKSEKFLNQYVEYDDKKAVYQYGERVGIVHFNRDTISKISSKHFSFFASNFCDIIKPISSEEVLFGTTTGVYYYNANKINQETTAKDFDLVFRKLMLGNKKYSSSANSIEVPYGDNTFIAEFSLPFYNHNNSTEYQYKLRGFDETWSDWSTTKYKEYTNLREGDYEFLVRSLNINQDISEIKSFNFKIIPPIYRSISAMVLYIITSIIFIWLIVIYNLKRVKKEKLQLQLIVEERTSKLSLQNVELKALHEEKDNILNIVAHDLRSPFNHIKGLIHLLTIDNALEEKQMEYVSKIENSIVQGNQLIRDLLDVSSVQQNTALNYETVSIKRLMDGLQSNCLNKAKEKSQQLIFNIETDVTSLKTDYLLLHRLLENLISNAIKYSEIGKLVTVTVSGGEDSISFSVIDQGPGFSKEDEALMFKKFQKLSAKPTNKESSTGLGLSIVKIIADKLGAIIKVNTTVGKGAEFIIELKNDNKITIDD